MQIDVRYFWKGELVASENFMDGVPRVGDHVRTPQGLRLVETVIWEDLSARAVATVCLSSTIKTFSDAD